MPTPKKLVIVVGEDVPSFVAGYAASRGGAWVRSLLKAVGVCKDIYETLTVVVDEFRTSMCSSSDCRAEPDVEM